MNKIQRSLLRVFQRTANKISVWAGSAAVFLGAILVVLVWASTGSFFDYSDTWQLVINTGTTIVTFLMVFLIQNTQNRDTKAIQLKLDELIHSNKKARDSFVGLEDLTDEELMELDLEFKRLNEKAEVTHAIKKLHKKIEAERIQRYSIRSGAGHVIGALLRPITRVTNPTNTPLDKPSSNDKK